MRQSYQITVVKNGRSHDVDASGNPMIIRQGESLKETLEGYGYSVAGFKKLIIDNEPWEVSRLDAYGISGDVTVEFVNKSEGGC